MKDKFICGSCHHREDDVTQFIQHKIKHSENGGIKCPFCGLREYAILKHYRDFHRIVLECLEYSSELPGDGCRTASKVPSENNSDSVRIDFQLLDHGYDKKVSSDNNSSYKNWTTSAGQNLNSEEDPKCSASHQHVKTVSVLNTKSSQSIMRKLLLEKDDIKMPITETTETQMSQSEQEEEDIEEALNTCKSKRKKRGISRRSKVEEIDFYFVLAATNIEKGDIGAVQCLKCLHCEFITSSDHAMLKHMKDHHIDIIMACDSLDISTLNDEQKKLWDNNDLVMKFSEFKKNYKQHQKGLHSILLKKEDIGSALFSCPKCDKAFKTIKYLRRHLVSHRTERDFLCDVCGDAFKVEGSLKRHRREWHENSGRSKSRLAHQRKKKQSAYREEYTCRQCGFTSAIHNLIHSHCQLHPKFCEICDVCGLAYSNEDTLSKHKKVHDPSRPYQCPYPECKWRFNNRVVCEAHYSNHTRYDSLFKCYICEKFIKSKNKLRKHVRNIHHVNEEPPILPHGKIMGDKCKGSNTGKEKVTINQKRSKDANSDFVERNTNNKDQNYDKLEILSVQGSVVDVWGDSACGDQTEAQTCPMVVDTPVVSDCNGDMRDCSDNVINNGDIVLSDGTVHFETLSGDSLNHNVLVIVDSDGNPINYELASNTTLLISHGK